MKTFVYLLALTALLFGGTGCKRKNPQITPLPAGRTGAPGPDVGGNPFPGPRNTTGPGVAVPTNEGPIGTSLSTPEGYAMGTRPDGMIADPEIFRSQTVYFDYDRSNVRPEEAAKVDAVADHLKGEPSAKIEIAGHCDERGTEEYNRSLGERRAQSVRELLISKGIAPERINTVSFGENQLLDMGQDESAHAKNRRGEFILLRAPQIR